MKNVAPILMGIALILIGTGFLLEVFHVVAFGSLLGTFWPLILIALAVARFMVGDWKGGILMGVIGIIAQLNALNVTDINIWAMIFPAILILVGFSVISKSMKGSKKDETGDTITETTVFSGNEKTVTSQSFTSASFLTVFGGNDIDLSKATFKEGKAVIDVLVAFGGTEIKVAQNAKVVFEVMAMFGGTSDKRKNSEPVKEEQVLVVKGLVLFGAVEVSAI